MSFRSVSSKQEYRLQKSPIFLKATVSMRKNIKLWVEHKIQRQTNKGMHVKHTLS